MPAEFGLYPRPLAEAALYGVLTALALHVWPLARARDIRAAELFRDLTAAAPRLAAPALRRRDRRASRAALVAARDAPLRRAASSRSAPPAGVAGALALLLARRPRPAPARPPRSAAGRLTRGRPALRWALGALGGPSGETASVVLALGLGLSVLAAVGQIDWNLRSLITRDLPARAPAFFFVDIQNDQLAGLPRRAPRADPGRRARSRPRRCSAASSPGSTAARPREVAGPHWALNGDRGVTYAAAPPPGTVDHRGRLVARGLRAARR